MAASFMSGIPALKELSADLKHRMDQAVSTFQANLASTRTGRASVHMLDQVKVDYYGTPTPINQVGQVSSPEAQRRPAPKRSSKRPIRSNTVRRMAKLPPKKRRQSPRPSTRGRLSRVRA